MLHKKTVSAVRYYFGFLVHIIENSFFSLSAIPAGNWHSSALLLVISQDKDGIPNDDLELRSRPLFRTKKQPNNVGLFTGRIITRGSGRVGSGSPDPTRDVS